MIAKLQFLIIAIISALVHSAVQFKDFNGVQQECRDDQIDVVLRQHADHFNPKKTMPLTVEEKSTESFRCIVKMMEWCVTEEHEFLWNLYVKILVSDGKELPELNFISHPSKCKINYDLDFTMVASENLHNSISSALEWLYDNSIANKAYAMRLPEMTTDAWEIMSKERPTYEDDLSDITFVIKNPREINFFHQRILSMFSILERMQITATANLLPQDVIKKLFRKAKYLHDIKIIGEGTEAYTDIARYYIISFDGTFTDQRMQGNHKMIIYCNLIGGTCYAKDLKYDHTLGYARFQYYSHKKGPALYLEVLKSMKNDVSSAALRGIGSSLLTAVLYIASKVNLEMTWVSLASARLFYEKLGFKALSVAEALEIGRGENEIVFSASKADLKGLMDRTGLKFNGEDSQIQLLNLRSYEYYI